MSVTLSGDRLHLMLWLDRCRQIGFLLFFKLDFLHFNNSGGGIYKVASLNQNVVREGKYKIIIGFCSSFFVLLCAWHF